MNQRIAHASHSCPSCNRCDRLHYDLRYDEYRCLNCGLISTVNEARAHFDELEVKDLKSEISFRPLYDHIAIEELPAEERSSGGLHIPESAQRQEGAFYRGKVVAVGEGERAKDGTRVPLQTKPGDEVLFYRNPATELRIPGTGVTCTVIHEEQYAVAIIER